jgi:hypothetical protein
MLALSCIWSVNSQNRSQDTDYPDWMLLQFSLVAPGRYKDSASDVAMTTSKLFAVHSGIVWPVDVTQFKLCTVFVNKP